MADVGIRDYLKGKGYKDDEITYNNGNVMLKNKFYASATPQADGSTYGDPNKLNQAFNNYNMNDALDTFKTSIGKPRAQFSYDPNSDQAYQSALGAAQRSAQTAGNNATVRLGARGIGNSQQALTTENQIQQRSVADVNSNILPQLINQAYTRYHDQQVMDDQNNDRYLQLAGTYNNLGQQDFNNNLATNQDARAAQAQDFSQGVTKAGLTGYYNDAAEAVKKQMAANSSAYASASPEEKKRLHEENLKLAASAGGVDTTGNGDYSFGQGSRTLAGQDFDNSVKQQGIDNQFKTQQMEQSAKQFAASQGLQWANLNQRQQEFVAEQAMKQQQLAAQNDPKSLDNQYKQAQINSLTAKTPTPTGIDEYDLSMIDTLAANKGVDLSKPGTIKPFIAELKSQYGWTTEEAKQVESYLTSKSDSDQGSSSGNFLPSFNFDSIKNNFQSGLGSFNGLLNNLPGSGGVNESSPGYIEYLKELAKKSNPMNLFK